MQGSVREPDGLAFMVCLTDMGDKRRGIKGVGVRWKLDRREVVRGVEDIRFLRANRLNAR